MRDTRPKFFHKVFLALALAVDVAVPASAFAQAGGFQDLLGLKGKRGAAQSPAEFSASLVPDGQPGEVALRIAVKLPPDHYIYSTTPGQGAETKITINRADGLEAIDDDFQADHPPKTEDDKYLGTLEKYYDKVIWSRHYRLESGVDPQNVSIAGLVKYQICDKQSCRPNQKFAFDVKLSGAAGVPNAVRSTTPPAAVEQIAGEVDQDSTRYEQMYGKKGSAQTVEGVWTVWLNPRQARPGDEVTVTVRAELNPLWHVYPLDLGPSTDGGSLPTVISITESDGMMPLDLSFKGPAPIEKKDLKGKIERYHEGRIEWIRRFKVPEDTPRGDFPLAGKVAWQMCHNRGFCLLATGFEFGGQLVVADEQIREPVALAVTQKLNAADAREAIDELSPGARVNVDIVESARVPAEPGSRSVPPSRSLPASNEIVHPAAPAFEVGMNDATTVKTRLDKSKGLPLFLMTAVLFGFGALLTPCVFPMIPITVSFFQKQSEQAHHRPVTMALVYCLGIVGTFTGLGMLMSVIFTASAIGQVANSVVLNLFIAGVLIFFAFNLLGMFEIRMPSWLLTYTAGKESKGGFVGVLFMALTFTLTSFTCTFAFAGGLLVAAQEGDRLWPILGLLAFSAAFSLPFFFLALFPSFLKKLPKSGGWMNVAKVVMGLIELGAAFKFLGTADQTMNGQPAIFDFHLMIAAWAVISVAASLYLFGMFRLPHDTPSDHIGVPRFVSAMSFLGFAAYLGVGLFGAEKPQGLVWRYAKAYANSQFDVGNDPTGPYRKHGDLKFALDFEKAFNFAIEEDKPLFLDFTGVNCTNCRFMEDGTMSRPQIEERLGRFVRIQLFTDAVPLPDKAEAERLRQFNAQLQESWFGDVTLPSYVVIPPDRSVLSDPTKIFSRFFGVGDETEFAQFLDQGWNRWQNVQASRAGRQVGRR